MNRENLITAATAFLSSQTVRDHPDETKRKFLSDKGLTNNEIIAAFAKSRNASEEKPQNFNLVMDKCIEEVGSPKNKPSPTRPSPPLVVVAAVSTAALGVVVYLYRLFRRYMWPWIVRQWKYVGGGGEDEPKKPVVVAMKEIVTSQMYELHDTISTIKSVLDQHQSQITEIAKKDPDAVEDLRKEMEAIKKLLLSKDSFPAAFPTQLPSWQIRRPDRITAQPVSTASHIPEHQISAPKIEEIPSQVPVTEPKSDPEDSNISNDISHVMISHDDLPPVTEPANDPEDNNISDDISHVMISHDDLSLDIVSHDTRLEAEEGSTDSSDSENETEADGDDKLYSECLGEDI